MYKTILPTSAAALLFLSVAAHAQSSSGSDTNKSGSGSSTSASDRSGQANDRARAMSQDKLRQVLSQAGFENIRVIDAAYLIQARTKDGEAVTMMLNPPAMAGSDGSARNTSGSGQSDNSKSGSGSSSSGSKN